MYCEEVNVPAVLVADEQFGRTVPARGHVVGERLAGRRECAREAKIAELYNARAVHQHVLGLHVAVNDLRAN